MTDHLYKVWLDSRKTETSTLVKAPSSFTARRWLAAQYGVEAIQIIAVRQYRDALPGEAVNTADY